MSLWLSVYLHSCWEENNATPSLLANVFTGSARASFLLKKKKISIWSVRYVVWRQRMGIRVRSDALQILMWVARLAKMRTWIFNASLTSVTPVSEAALTVLEHNLGFPFSTLPSCSCGNWRSSIPVLSVFSSLWCPESLYYPCLTAFYNWMSLNRAD